MNTIGGATTSPALARPESPKNVQEVKSANSNVGDSKSQSTPGAGGSTSTPVTRSLPEGVGQKLDITV